jgi:hypothetical protein
MRSLITGMLFLTATVSFAQDINLDSAAITTALVEFNGGKYNGYQVELNAAPDIVENAVRERFKQQGSKPKETKDFLVYRNVVMPLIDATKPIDAFIKVERKSRKEKEQSVVFLIATLPGEIPEDKVKSGAATGLAVITPFEKGGNFLTGFLPDVKQGVYEKDRASQQSQLKKEEKKLADLVAEQADMEKKLKKLQSDIEYGVKAQENQAAEVEKAKDRLNDLVNKNPKHH